MLQRLTHKSPSPLRVSPTNSNFYTRDGQLRDSVATLCRELKIDPSDLQPKTLADFQNPNVPENIQILRFNNYEAKRQTRFDMLKSILSQKTPGKMSPSRISALALKAGSQPSLMVIHELPSLSGGLKKEGSSITDKRGFFFTDVAMMNRASKMGSDDVSTPGYQQKGMRSRLNIEPVTPMFTDRGRENRSESAEVSLKNSNMRAERMMEFDKNLERKKRNQEKACVISRAMMEQHIEYKRVQRDNWEEKMVKLAKAMENKNKKHENKVQKIEDAMKKTTDRFHQIQKTESQSRKELSNLINTKISETSRRRKEFIDDRVKKAANLNTQNSERQQLYTQRKELYELQSTPDLSLIESRIMTSQKRAQSNRNTPNRLSMDFEDRLKRVREDEEGTREAFLQKTVEKLMRSSSIQFSQLKNKKEGSTPLPATERLMNHTMKMEEVRQNELEAERRLVDEVREKNTRSAQRIDGRKAQLDSFIAERKEAWVQKMEKMKDSQHLMAQASERQYEEKFDSYKTKINQIMTDREIMKKKREKVQESVRVMFEGRYRGLVNN